MFIFGILFIVGGILTVLCAIYVTRQFHKLPFIEIIDVKFDESGNRRPKIRTILSWALAAMPVIILGVVAFFEPMTSAIFLLNLAAIMGIIGIIGRVANKQFAWKPLVALVLTFVYMCYGWYTAYNVVETDYIYKNGTVSKCDETLSNQKNSNGLRIAMISDAHLGNSFDGDGFTKYLSNIQKKNPDILVLVGDIVDEGSKKEDVDKLCESIKKFKAPLGKYFAYGNHDKGFNRPRDFDTQEFFDNLKNGGVRILEDESVLVADSFYITGRKDRSDKTRLDANQLIEPLDKTKFTILLDHQPNDYDNEAKAGFNLVLSGHTHGGQLIPLSIFDSMLGFNDAAYGAEKIDNTNFIVSSGISDWKIHCKTGTCSEFVVIDIDDVTIQ